MNSRRVWHLKLCLNVGLIKIHGKIQPVRLRRRSPPAFAVFCSAQTWISWQDSWSRAEINEHKIYSNSNSKLNGIVSNLQYSTTTRLGSRGSMVASISQNASNNRISKECCVCVCAWVFVWSVLSTRSIVRRMFLRKKHIPKTLWFCIAPMPWQRSVFLV